ncbi:MAG: aldehyde dehydrogenase family protein [Deltaproteobacteria bacterium]|nr:aldehyde dehydrogenase family protein [Deltaproteobacteria bacterium]
MSKRAPILKTYKLFINGQFLRCESGHYFQVLDPKTKKPLANAARASRKDLRDAVKAARAALPGWSAKTAYNRGQILYRMAEILENRKAQFPQREVLKAIDWLVWYAGWSDKYQQIFGTVNPVALPYFNFTLPEPTGVVGILAADEWPLLPLVSQIAPALVAGNTLVVIASEQFPLTAITFAEVLATSDLPGGVVNILTGFKKELIPHLAKHMDVNAVHYAGKDKEVLKAIQEEAAGNVKRVITVDPLQQSPYHIQAFTEMKTTWHPVGV